MNHFTSNIPDKMSSQERLELQMSLKAEFHLLPVEQQRKWQQKADEEHMARRVDQPEERQELDNADDVRAARAGLVGLSSSELPIAADKFREFAGVGDGEASFRSWGVAARGKFRKSIFVKDSGAIPQTARVTFRKSCSQMHFDICRTKDASIIETVLQCGGALWQYVWHNVDVCSWLRFYIATSADIGTPASQFTDMVCCLAYSRGSDPRLALFLKGPGFHRFRGVRICCGQLRSCSRAVHRDRLVFRSRHLQVGETRLTESHSVPGERLQH